MQRSDSLLDKFVIFSRTGVVLFSLYWNALTSDPMNDLVRDVLLPQRSGSQADYGDYHLRWSESHKEGLVFCATLDRAMAQHRGTTQCVEYLLKAVRDAFINKHGEELRGDKERLPLRAALAQTNSGSVISSVEDPVVEVDAFNFQSIFDRCLRAAEQSSSGEGEGRSGGSGGLRSSASSKKTTSAISSSSPALPIPGSPSRGAAAASSSLAGEDDDDDDEDGIDADAAARSQRAGILSASPPSPSSPGGGGTVAAKSATAAASPAATSSKASDSAAAVEEEDDDDDAAMMARRAKLRAGGKKLGPGGGTSKKTSSSSPSSSAAATKGRDTGLSSLPVDPSSRKVSKEMEKQLDASGSGDADSSVERVTYTYDGSSGSGGNLLEEGDEEVIEKALREASSGSGSSSNSSSSSSSSSNSSSNSSSSGGGFSSWFSKSAVGSFLSKLAGTAVIDKAALDPVLEQLKSHLTSKNVAHEVADHLIEKVGESLLGKSLGISASVASIVQVALSSSISQILTPQRAIDVLSDVRAKKASKSGKPYVIVFVGVNGVGKSTTLSKVAYHFKENRASVMIAACDSFRSGAVEQLKRHCMALDVPLFSQGYDKDPVQIAAAAIKDASAKGMDVVLVDTAGRMQNNTGLMVQIARVVSVNKPDLVLFVGEALVGNDGVDQLVEFDKALINQSPDSQAPHHIDGIVLTKFDTIDDKVGASLSMVYKTRIPIVFLGTGQKYMDLRKLNVGAVVKSLLQ